MRTNFYVLIPIRSSSISCRWSYLSEPVIKILTKVFSPTLECQCIGIVGIVILLIIKQPNSFKATRWSSVIKVVVVQDWSIFVQNHGISLMIVPFVTGQFLTIFLDRIRIVRLFGRYKSKTSNQNGQFQSCHLWRLNQQWKLIRIVRYAQWCKSIFIVDSDINHWMR